MGARDHSNPKGWRFAFATPPIRFFSRMDVVGGTTPTHPSQD
ncbi:hypothetical protein PHAMO_40135 [Magnetospirillum molischianum DSM 120]|uniref:Uncharacterized protein n=1 Tax=Magnetospirillum molischianum DSM 120 TaxID=1150626 RepID=H8FW36_MAGML|nr:hypothetical protein PHAMO_40135 [Magnetospirillum molischianum DSM 120]